MQQNRELEGFLKHSPYHHPVDIKKLRFIFSAIDDYRKSKHLDFRDLRILEVACGRGGITLPLASLGCLVTAFDIDNDSIGYLEDLLRDKRIENVNVSVDDGYTFDDHNSYDIAVASEVFEHLLDPLAFAKNISRRMDNGSHLIVTTPNGFGPWELKNHINPINRLRKWNVLRRLRNKPPYVKGAGHDHCQFYTRRRLESMFATMSFRTLRFAKSDSFLVVLPFARRSALLGRMDVTLADYLPYWLASGWYFVFELQS